MIGGVVVVLVLIVRCWWLGFAVLASNGWNIEILFYLMTFLLAIVTALWSFKDHHASASIAAVSLVILALLNMWIGVCRMSAAQWRWVDFEWLVLPDIVFAIAVALRYVSRSVKAVPEAV